MPERNYRVILDEENSIFVYFETIQGTLTSFVVKFITIIDDEEVEILRFDSAHGMPHIDILGPDSETKQKIWLSSMSNEDALNYAKKNIKEHYQQYRERFIQWKKQKQ
ncbi:MAG: hypothetical protein HY960_14135 [Ignavibacteriae bacterium]|nr:hypothetical protein [Ignavibacteriota bacterium]